MTNQKLNSNKKIIPPSLAYLYIACPHAMDKLADSYSEELKNINREYPDSRCIVPAAIRAEIEDVTTSGVAAHDLAASILTGETRLTDDVPEDIQSYVNYVCGLEKCETSGDIMREIERPLSVSRYFQTYCNGRADCIIYDQTDSKLYVIDLKTGSRPVYVNADGTGNGTIQLILYAYTYMREMSIYPREIEITAFRGRAYSAIFDVYDFEEKALEIMQRIAEVQADTERSPVHDMTHCRQCPLHGACQHYKTNLHKIFNDMAHEPIDSMTPEELFVCVGNYVKALEGYKTKVEEIAKKTYYEGGPMPTDWTISSKGFPEYSGGRILNKNEI